MTRHHPLFVILLTTCSLLAEIAQGGPLADQIRKSIDQYENAVRANTLKIIAATTEQEKAQYRASIPSPQVQATEVLKLVKDNLSQPDAIQGVTWLATQCINLPEGQEALHLLAENFADSPEIAAAVRQMEYQPYDLIRPALTAIQARNSTPTVLAAAHFVEGVHAFRASEAATSPEQREASKEEAMMRFQTVLANYPEETIQGFKLADQASDMLFEIANLTPGAVVPDVTGKDIDGTEFSITDYRGKYVVLIFWGDWCHGCHGVQPALINLANRFKDQPLQILGVNTDPASTA
ncbi:MAG: TlpA family protein disulfide reductase, partial [Verrucomicrobiales bacterium]|nr:TlpA family protein disulfide reductase [Verrucomicrobiales bacterium]